MNPPLKVFYVKYTFPLSKVSYMPIKASTRLIARARFQNAIVIFNSKVEILDVLSESDYVQSLNTPLL